MIQAPPSQAMSQRAYAKRRGVSQAAVSRAVQSGRLKASVAPGGGIADPDLADREWDANTDTSRAPVYVQVREAARRQGLTAEPLPRDPSHGGRPPKARAHAHPGGAPPSDGEPRPVLGGGLNENNAVKAYWQARQAELDYRADAGELVEASDVRGAVEEAFRRCRGKLLALSSRLAQQVPELGVAGAAAVERLVREALEELAAEAVVK